ncbi:retrotransposon protein, putative, ty1-copia subclass [Tanacetum coccineum]
MKLHLVLPPWRGVTLKAIYGLKQASRSWYLCFHEKVTQFGFFRSGDESCIYVKVSGSVVVFLVLYMDDILLIGNDIPTLQSVKDWLGKCFAMKDLGDAAYILGIKIYRDRIDHNPGEGHWTAVKNILKYLRNTKDKFLVYGEEKDLRNEGAVTWKSSKQDTVADSACKSEYIAACEASKEAIWMKNLVGDLGVVSTIQDPIEILCDNENAVTLTKEPKDHSSAVAMDGTLCLVNQDRLRPIIVDDLSKWETVGFSV